MTTSMGESDNDENIQNENEEEKEEGVIQQFADKLFKEVSKTGNFLISPVIVETTLAMIYQGATGKAAEKIASVLKVPNQKAAADKYKKEMINFKDLIIANQIFITKDVPLKNTFESVIEESFKSKVHQVDFSATKTTCDYINQWAEEKTQNKIKNLISPDCLDSSASLVLANAIYFKSDWETPFLDIDTTIQPFFTSKTEAVDCEMMFVTNFFKYVNYHSKTGGKLIEIPFRGNELSLIIITVEWYANIQEVEDNLKKIDLSKLIQDDDVELKKIQLFLPKFKIEATIDIKPLLEKMGLETIFDSNTADFSEISESSKSLHVSQFLQKTCIEIDTKGSEVAAVPESRESLMTSPEFIAVDHPFIYILKANSEHNDTVLLVGKVLNPLG